MGNAQLNTIHLPPQEDKQLHPNLRDAELRDFQGIIELMYEFDCIHYEMRPGYYQKPSKPGRSNSYILNAIMNPLEKLYVFDHDGDLTGLVHLRINPYYKRDAIVSKRSLAVLEIVAKEPEENPHISMALNHAVEKFAVESCCSTIYADLDERNTRAQKFVTHNGGRPVSVRYIRNMRVEDKGMHEDTLLSTRLYRKWIKLKIRLFALVWRP